MSEAAAFYSVKMRAARGGVHISGAEKIVPAPSVPKVASALVARALTHATGVPDFVNLKVEAQPGPIRRLPALAVTTHATRTAHYGALSGCLSEKRCRCSTRRWKSSKARIY